MAGIIKIKDITNWEEMFELTYEYLSFLMYDEDIKAELVIKCTFDMIKNCGFRYTYKEVAEQYYNKL